MVLVVMAATAVEAQYFGRNEVMYDDFDFRILRTDHFDIHFYQAESVQAVQDFGRVAERCYERLARTFQDELEEREPIIVYRNQPDFQQTNAVPGFISQATGGVTESLKSDEEPTSELSERSVELIPVFSAGASARVNLLGRLVLETYYAHPFQRPDAGGQLGFQVAPGW